MQEGNSPREKSSPRSKPANIDLRKTKKQVEKDNELPFSPARSPFNRSNRDSGYLTEGSPASFGEKAGVFNFLTTPPSSSTHLSAMAQADTGTSTDTLDLDSRFQDLDLRRGSNDSDSVFASGINPQASSTPISIPRAGNHGNSNMISGATGNTELYNSPRQQGSPVPQIGRPIPHHVNPTRPLMHRYSTGSFTFGLSGGETETQGATRTQGTQTLSPQGEMISHLMVQGNLDDFDDDFDAINAGAVGIRERRVSYHGTAAERLIHRPIFNNDDDDEDFDDVMRTRSGSSPLPDVIPPTPRDRARSEAFLSSHLRRTRTESAIGQELRRISDEFHLSYRKEDGEESITYRSSRTQDVVTMQSSSYPREANFLTRMYRRYFCRDANCDKCAASHMKKDLPPKK